MVEHVSAGGVELEWQGSLYSVHLAFPLMPAAAVVWVLGAAAVSISIVAFGPSILAAVLAACFGLCFALLLVGWVGAVVGALLLRRTGRCALSLIGFRIGAGERIAFGRELRFQFVAHVITGLLDVARTVVQDQVERPRRFAVQCGLDVVVDGVRHPVARRVSASQALTIADALRLHWPRDTWAAHQIDAADPLDLDALDQLRSMSMAHEAR